MKVKNVVKVAKHIAVFVKLALTLMVYIFIFYYKPRYLIFLLDVEELSLKNIKYILI